jgi:hypothetical protein
MSAKTDPMPALRLNRETLATLALRPANAVVRPPALTGKCVTFSVGAIRGHDAA